MKRIELSWAGVNHQKPEGKDDIMTTAQGAPVADDQNWLKAGSRGPALLEDQVAREKIFHFDHERIPERVVHARGYGVHGHFELTDPVPELTCAAPLSGEKGKKTPVFVRFSTVAGSMGSPDLARDVRGFAVKFYTEEGNWDIVGNNIPVFFIQDAMKFPDLIHAAKPAPDRGFPQAQTAHDNFWDFISLTPEAMHMVMWIMSDRSIPRSFRFMEGFGVHTFRLVNADGKATFVKFHWKPRQGMQSVLWNEAVKINGADPDFHRRDMWDAIDAGEFPQWDLGIQVFDEEFAENFEFDVLDATKIIPEEQVPVRRIGTLTLDANVENFFAETEQVAFCTQNIVPGIDFTEDPLLQGRNFSYLDTQLKRLGGPNFTHIPVNAPRCPVRHFQQDGHMAMRNPKGRANYEPNSWGEGTGEMRGPRACPMHGATSVPVALDGVKQRERSETFADHYSQARQFYVSQTPVEQAHMVDALTFELSKVERVSIRERMVGHLLNIDEGLARAVAEGLGLKTMPEAIAPARRPLENLPPSEALSILANAPDTLRGRKFGIYLADGADAGVLAELIRECREEGAMVEIIAPHVGGAVLSDGTTIPADQKIDGAPSVLFDAVVILMGEEAGKLFDADKPSIDFVSDAFAHAKFIGFVPEVMPLLKSASVASWRDEGFVDLGADGGVSTFMTRCKALRFWERQAVTQA